jgi:hypothetical protein
MLPINTRHNVIASLVPDNPKNGEIFVMPEGQVLGASHVISLVKNGELVGDASQLAPVPNVAGKSLLSKVTARLSLQKGVRIRVLAQQFSYKSAIFIQFFGWMGRDLIDKTIVISDKEYRVDYALRVGPDSDKFFIYEKVCLTNVEEKTK